MTRHYSPNHIATDDPNGLSMEELRQYVPSLYAEQPHSSRSESYEYVPSIEVLRALGREGFRIMSAMQSKTRDAGKREYVKHMVRMRNKRDDGAYQELRPEVIIINAHDGSSSYVIATGANIFACSNGLLFGDGLNMVRVHHLTKGLSDSVIEGSVSLVERNHLNIHRLNRLREVTITPAEARHFAEMAMGIKYGDEAPNLDPVRLLSPRRDNDRGLDLYRVFNVVQENLIRGGISTVSPHGRRSHTRPVLNIDADVRINSGLWGLARETYEQHTGKALA
jgi:hypothetical protein